MMPWIQSCICRYFVNTSFAFAEIVQDHVRKVGANLNDKIANWARDVALHLESSEDRRGGESCGLGRLMENGIDD